MGRCLKNAYGLFYGALPQTPFICISDGVIMGRCPKPRQRDTIPLEAHFRKMIECKLYLTSTPIEGDR